jgi:translation initiation factor 3 subunit I
MRPLIIHGHKRPLTQVKFNLDGDLLFTSSKDAQLCVWSSKTGKHIGSFEGHGGAVSSFDVTYDSKYLVSGAWDGYVRVFEVSSGALLASFELVGIVRSVEWNTDPSDQFRFVSVSDDFVPRQIKR